MTNIETTVKHLYIDSVTHGLIKDYAKDNGFKMPKALQMIVSSFFTKDNK